MEKGPASPGRWQTWQFFWRMGATSLVNVGADTEVMEGAEVDARLVGGGDFGCEGEIADCTSANVAVKGISSANQGRPLMRESSRENGE